MLSRVERLEPLRDDARRESTAIRQVLSEREEQALTAARLSPPPYIVKELGERPREPAKAKAWDQGVKTIESYRQEHGVTDRQGAFGREPRSNSQKAAREAAQRRVREAQLRLGRAPARAGKDDQAEHQARFQHWPLRPRPARLWHRACGRQPPAGVGRCAPLTAAARGGFWAGGSG